MGEVIDMEKASKKIRRKKRRVGSLTWIFISMFFFGAMICGFGFARSAFFNIQTINVSGNSSVSTDTILGLSGFTRGEHIYAVDLEKAEIFIGTNHWMQSVTVTRDLPSTINIEVLERVPVAGINTSEGLYVIDATGVLLEKRTLVDGISVMIIAGAETIDVDTKLGTVLDGTRLQVALSVILQMSKDALGMISEINVKDTQNIIAYTTSGVEIYLGDKSEFLSKYAVAMQILNTEDAKGNLANLDYIDVSIYEKPTLAYETY